MSKPAITVQNLGKSYQVGQNGRGYRTLAETLTLAASRPFQRGRGSRTETHPVDDLEPSNGNGNGNGNETSAASRFVGADTFWALKEVSFEVPRGEVMGIIGRNGAGKSTLLKILSRITEPTAGKVRISGRVASLLEVGTGFHPELSGRENVYLNGAILGMTKHEIERHFDQIVEFAEVEKFIDTPVKRYSSGMYLRLAFAVAAHLEPEILIVDEVLAVGDAQFQRKCLGKLNDAAHSGRTILFVSHNLPAIQHTCTSCLFLESGRVGFLGDVPTALKKYAASIQTASANLRDRYTSQLRPEAYFTGIEFTDQTGEAISAAASGEPLNVLLHYDSARKQSLVFTIGIYDQFGLALARLSTKHACHDPIVGDGPGSILCAIPRLPLPAGEYHLNLALWHSDKRTDHVEKAAVLHVDAADFYGTGRAPESSSSIYLVDHKWATYP